MAIITLFVAKPIIDAMGGFAGLHFVPQWTHLQPFLTYIHYGHTMADAVRSMSIVYVLSLMPSALKYWRNAIRDRDFLKAVDLRVLGNKNVESIARKGSGARALYDVAANLSSEEQKRAIAGWIESGKLDVRGRPDFAEKLAKKVGAAKWEPSRSYEITTGLRAVGLTLVSPVLILVSMYHGMALLSGKKFSLQSAIPFLAKAGRNFWLRSWHMSIIGAEIHGVTAAGNTIAAHSGIFGKILNAPIQAMEAPPQADLNNPGHLAHPYSAMSAVSAGLHDLVPQDALSHWTEKVLGIPVEEQNITNAHVAYNELTLEDFFKSYPQFKDTIKDAQAAKNGEDNHLSYDEFRQAIEQAEPQGRIVSELEQLLGGEKLGGALYNQRMEKVLLKNLDDQNVAGKILARQVGPLSANGGAAFEIVSVYDGKPGLIIGTPDGKLERISPQGRKRR